MRFLCLAWKRSASRNQYGQPFFQLKSSQDPNQTTIRIPDHNRNHPGSLLKSLPGGTVWDAALLLSAYLSRWRRLQRCCVLELGSGTGLVGLVASRLGAEAIAMENHNFSWENPLFLWSFSIAMLVYQRVGTTVGNCRVSFWQGLFGKFFCFSLLYFLLFRVD